MGTRKVKKNKSKQSKSKSSKNPVFMFVDQNNSSARLICSEYGINMEGDFYLIRGKYRDEIIPAAYTTQTVLKTSRKSKVLQAIREHESTKYRILVNSICVDNRQQSQDSTES